MKIFNHIGIPTKEVKQDEIHLAHLKMYVTDHEKSPNGIQWMRFEDGAPYPELVLEPRFPPAHSGEKVGLANKTIPDHSF